MLAGCLDAFPCDIPARGAWNDALSRSDETARGSLFPFLLVCVAVAPSSLHAELTCPDPLVVHMYVANAFAPTVFNADTPQITEVFANASTDRRRGYRCAAGLPVLLPLYTSTNKCHSGVITSEGVWAHRRPDGRHAGSERRLTRAKYCLTKRSIQYALPVALGDDTGTDGQSSLHRIWRLYALSSFLPPEPCNRQVLPCSERSAASHITRQQVLWHPSSLQPGCGPAPRPSMHILIST